MGNNNVSGKEGGDSKRTPGTSSRLAAGDSAPDPHIVTAFQRIAHGDERVTIAAFKKDFGARLGSALFRYLSDGMSEDEGGGAIDVRQFGRHARSLIGTSTDVYIQMLLPGENLLRVALESAGVHPDSDDRAFLQALSRDMTQAGDRVHDVIAWKTANCERMCNAIQARVLHHFTGAALPPAVDYSSDVLSSAQMWFLQCALPQFYFPKIAETTANDCCKSWTPLYSSAEHGISVNRFEANVFGYRGPTVSIFQLADGQLFALAIDQEWRHGSTRFGGVNTVLIQLMPSYRRCESSSSVYCNFKLRSSSFGISFNKDLVIDKEMNNVRGIEVWGCSGVKTLQEQQKLKQWQSRQIEKHGKVPLPGNWDENPDKFLLELAGVGGSNLERAHIVRRDDRDPIE